MSPREMLIELLAQTIAPRLYQLCGDKPEEMGFPIYDTKEEVEDHLGRQFDPVNYWLGRARELAETVVAVIEAGGTEFTTEPIDAMFKEAEKHRPDRKDGETLSLGTLT